jgi:hypothetical protein
VTALTPDCDPDLSNCGSPSGRPGGGVRSTLVLFALVTLAVLALRSSAKPVGDPSGSIPPGEDELVPVRGVTTHRRVA